MGETKKCKHCQEEIDKKAKACPNCKRKQGGKGKFIAIGIVVVVFLFTILSGGEDEPKATKTGNVSTGEEKGSKEENNTEEVINEFKVGDIVETKDLKITFLSAGEYKSDNEFLQPKDGNKYIKVEFEIENTGDSDQYITSWDFKCYADTYSVEQTWLDEGSLDATLSKGKKSKGSVFFEVPKDAKEITLEYETNFFSEDKIIFIVQ